MLRVDGISVLSNYVRSGGFSDNFVTISGFDSLGDGATTHLFDNFVVSVPEPSGGLVACLASAVGLTTRRRTRVVKHYEMTHGACTGASAAYRALLYKWWSVNT